jgi:hypothetical protein
MRSASVLARWCGIFHKSHGIDLPDAIIAATAAP